MANVSSSVHTAQEQSKSQPLIQEFSIRVPKTNKKKHNVMRFNAVLKVDFKEWKQVKLERENNMKDFRGVEEEMPKFGAGSEFGRDAREEARKKKFGINSRKYKSEDQPWILKVNGKTGKKFKGIREGGVSANASYYVFTHAPDGAIEAFPLHEWYNFQPIQRYKALSAEEAEEEFNRRNKTMNYFNLMMRKRLRNDEEVGEEGEILEGKKKITKKDKELKISEMDEWIESDEEESEEDEESKKKSEDEDDDKKKKKKDGKKKKKKVSDDEAFEESDDGDEEGRECDYISDSSASEDELESQKEIKSVDQEDALRKLLASDEEDEEENEDKKDEDENEDDEGKPDKEKDPKEPNKKKDKKKKKKKDDGSDSSSDVESGAEQNKKPASTQSSRSATPIIGSASQLDSLKRSYNSSPDLPQAKKSRLDNGSSSSTSSSTYVPGSSESGITEDAVRRYLMRKPMTTIELLQKFKSKKTGLTSEQIVTIMTNVLKNVKPTSQKIKGKMYFSIKAQPNNKQ
ncbi:general transcription factor IIF subunit 1 [Phymastichus coffea]|uniref:general transcription factor IIF subunit 1 n=1 Tax=Phymastichus coffea TaxID=108790 RepID=UPI00273A8E3D|nr:general transcription factor IIF subunit 1 [Phymastichus coffea]